MNLMIMTSEGAFFHDAMDTSDCETPAGKDAAFVADWIIKAIEEIGAEHVVSIVTDGASVMKAAWKIVTNKFPHIVCTWCAAHVLDLLCEDLGKLAFFNTEIDTAKDIVKFINNHEWTRKTFKASQKNTSRYFFFSLFHPVAYCLLKLRQFFIIFALLVDVSCLQ